MKKRACVFPMFIATLLASCGPGKSRATAYNIGDKIEYKIKGYDVSMQLENEREKERFVWTYKTDEPKGSEDACFFDFCFTAGDFSTKNDKVFEIESDGEKIEFANSTDGGYPYYSFSGSKTIYIIYKNVNDDIKKCIESNEYMILTASYIWIPNE